MQVLPLRVKVTLALLGTSLTSIALFWFVARWLVLSEFNRTHQSIAFERYVESVTAYLEQYGSWDEASQQESFEAFDQRRSIKTGTQAFSVSGELSSGHANGASALEKPFGSHPGGHDPHRPPFRFLLLDTDGRVLMGNEGGRADETPPEDVLKNRSPIRVKGRVVAYAIPIESPNLSPLDVKYLDSVHWALTSAVAAASVLAIALGAILGARLSMRLDKLTAAIRAMRPGELRQTVDIASNDEIGALAGAFNRMSAELAQAHEELQLSAAKIHQQAAVLEELSIRDPLTELFNRRYFDEQARRALAQARRYGHPFTLMIGDIDHFKPINDNFSHAKGDEVLRRVATILQSNTRDSDLVARYGGEEFVIAFPETAIAQAAALCEKLRRLIESHPWHEVHPDLNVTISMGLCGDTGEPFETVLATADANLYRAKGAGRNRVGTDQEVVKLAAV